MKLLGNILWHFPFFGFITAASTWLLGLILTITVVFAPIGRGLMELGIFLFHPFGYEMVDKKDLGLQSNELVGTYSAILALLYIVFFGIWLAIGAAIQGALLLITILGIPVGLVVIKSLGTFLNPIGKKCVPIAVKN